MFCNINTCHCATFQLNTIKTSKVIQTWPNFEEKFPSVYCKANDRPLFDMPAEYYQTSTSCKPLRDRKNWMYQGPARTLEFRTSWKGFLQVRMQPLWENYRITWKWQSVELEKPYCLFINCYDSLLFRLRTASAHSFKPNAARTNLFQNAQKMRNFWISAAS